MHARNGDYMTHYEIGDAVVDCGFFGGVLVADFTGDISLENLYWLDAKLLERKYHAETVLESIADASVHYSNQLRVVESNFPWWSPPSAVIVRADQYPCAWKFCRELARIGVHRTCWLPNQVDLARLWLRQYAGS